MSQAAARARLAARKQVAEQVLDFAQALAE
jgi:hypothetical protein